MTPDPSVDDPPDFDLALALDYSLHAPVRWECGWAGCLDKGRWWRSVQGVILCTNCHPPAWPALVAEQGDASNAPLVHPDRTSTAWDPSPEPDNSGRPLWILRGDRVPEKVEAREGRRKVEIPADATHWCHEGGREWIPLYRARPSDAAPARRRPVRGEPKDGLDFQPKP